jgi:hypothetical protein
VCKRRSAARAQAALEAPLEGTQPLVLVDTAGCGFDEHDPESHAAHAAQASSPANAGEAAVVCRVVAMLAAAGIGAEDMAVITPYNGQVSHGRPALGRTDVSPKPNRARARLCGDAERLTAVAAACGY